MQSDAQEWVKAAIAAIVVVGFVVLVFLLVFHALPDDSPTITVMFGSLGTLAGAIVQYYFGSSRSSQLKDDTINKQAGR